ncbi:MAG: hypothetical protein WAM73_12700 [Desulfobacterales bacterium]
MDTKRVRNLKAALLPADMPFSGGNRPGRRLSGRRPEGMIR